MKFSIAHRVFLAVLLTALMVAVGGLAVWRSTMQQGFSHYVAEVELGRLGTVADLLAQDYQQHGSWPTLTPEQQKFWLHGYFMRVRALPFARDSGIFPASDFPQAPGPPPDDTAPQPPLDSHGLPAPPPDGFQHGGAGPGPGNPPPAFGPPDFHGLHSHPPAPPGGHMDRLGLPDRTGLTDASGNYIAGSPAAPDDPRRAIVVGGKTVGYLTVVETANPSDDLARAFLADQTRNLLFIGIACVLISALAAALLAAHFRSPIRRLAQLTQALTEGRFNTRLHVDRSDELGDLSQHVNQLAHILEQHESSRRQWVADTSHELRTPVSVLRAQIEALQDGIRRPEPGLFAAMHRQVTTLGKLIDDLYTLARADVGTLDYHWQSLDPWVLAQEEAESFQQRFTEAGISLELAPANATTTVRADAARLRQIYANLLENCLRYCPEGTRVRLSASVNDEHWIFRIDDSGPGVDAATLTRLGERFFRAEQSRSREFGGSGLGLALCRRSAEAHGGQLEFSRSELGGLAVSLSLPLEKNT